MSFHYLLLRLDSRRIRAANFGRLFQPSLHTCTQLSNPSQIRASLDIQPGALHGQLRHETENLSDITQRTTRSVHGYW